jgi:hypothetical protein
MEQIPLQKVLHYECKNAFMLEDKFILVPCACPRTIATSAFCKDEKHVQTMTVDIDEISKHGQTIITFYIFADENNHCNHHTVHLIFEYVGSKLQLTYLTRVDEHHKQFNEVCDIYWPKKVKETHNVVEITYNSHEYSLECEFNDRFVFKHLLLVDELSVQKTCVYKVLVNFEIYRVHAIIECKINMVKSPLGVKNKRGEYRSLVKRVMIPLMQKIVLLCVMVLFIDYVSCIIE